MFKNFKIILVGLVPVIVYLSMGMGVAVVEARQGCCSGRGGVCGCQCCNGSRLSAVCQSYYPQCKSVSNMSDRHDLKQNKNDKAAAESDGLQNGWWLAAALIGIIALTGWVATRRGKMQERG